MTKKLLNVGRVIGSILTMVTQACTVMLTFIGAFIASNLMIAIWASHDMSHGFKVFFVGVALLLTVKIGDLRTRAHAIPDEIQQLTKKLQNLEEEIGHETRAVVELHETMRGVNERAAQALEAMLQITLELEALRTPPTLIGMDPGAPGGDRTSYMVFGNPRGPGHEAFETMLRRARDADAAHVTTHQIWPDAEEIERRALLNELFPTDSPNAEVREKAWRELIEARGGPWEPGLTLEQLRSIKAKRQDDKLCDPSGWDEWKAMASNKPPTQGVTDVTLGDQCASGNSSIAHGDQP